MRKLLFVPFCLAAVTVQAAEYHVTNVTELTNAVAKGSGSIFLAKGVYNLVGCRSGGYPNYANLSSNNGATLRMAAESGLKRGDVVLQGGDTRIFYMNKGLCTFTNLTFVGGASGGPGAAFYIANGDGGYDFYDCVFTNNVGAEGGALGAYHSGTTLASRSRKITNCLFVNNESTAGGGALQALGVVVSNCTFVGNIADQSGGAALDGTYYDCQFVSNVAKATAATTSAAASKGGGAIGSLGRRQSCVRCVFEGNSCSNDGAHGAAIRGAGALTNCTFVGNFMTWNEVIYQYDDIYGCTFVSNRAAAMLVGGSKIENSAFIENVAISSSAQMFNDCGVLVNTLISRNRSSNGDLMNGSPRLINCTVVDNTGGSTADKPLHSVLPPGAVAVNCILANNQPRDISGGETSKGATHCPTMTNCLWVTQNATNAATKAVIDRFATNCKALFDPKFIGAGDHPYMIKSSSPARDAGYEDEGVRAAVGDLDLAKGTRRMFKAIDIGCYEVQKLPGLMLLVR